MIMKREEIRRNIRLGVLVIVAVLLFLVAVFYVGSENSLFSSGFQLQANFTDVNGLQKGDNVWLSGVKVGTVRDVSIGSNAAVQVSMRINEDLRPYIKKDAAASISSDGLVGNPIVVITPGNDAQAVSDGDVLRTAQQTSTQDMMNSLQATADNINNITDELREIMHEVNQEGTIGALLSDTTLESEIKLSIDNIQTTGRRSAAMVNDLRAMVNQLQANQKGLVNTLLTDTAFAGTYDQTLANIRAAGESTAEATAELNNVVEKIDNTNNAAGVLLNDTAFASNLKEIARSLSAGVEKFDENMEAVRHNFLFRRYFRKKRREERQQKQATAEEGAE